MKKLFSVLVLAVTAVVAPTVFAAEAGAAPTSLTEMVGGFNLSEASGGVLAAGGAVAGVVLVIYGVRKVLGLFRA